MKIKLGFVTNSSSTSHIIAWPFKIEKIEDVQRFILDKYADRVYKDACKQEPTSTNDDKCKSTMFDAILQGYTELPVMDEWDNPDNFCHRNDITYEELITNSMWRDQYNKYRDKKYFKSTHTYITKFIEELKHEHFIYIFHYENNDIEYLAEMESEDMFTLLKGIRIIN